MNEQLQIAISELIIKSTHGAEFLVSQAPDVIKQLLIWKAFLGCAEFLIGLSLIFLIFKGYKFAQNKAEQATYDSEIVWIWFCVYAFIFGLVSIPFLIGIFTTLQIIIAPKSWLLEYALKFI